MPRTGPPLPLDTPPDGRRLMSEPIELDEESDLDVALANLIIGALTFVLGGNES